MKEDPCNPTRWKHERVWDKRATDWAREEDWMSKRQKYHALEDKTKFGTFTLDSVKLSTVHKKEKEKEKKVDDKAPSLLGPADTIIHTREEGSMASILWD